MASILISGASGNIGYEIISGLYKINTQHKIIAGDYNIENAQKVLAKFENLEFRKLDFSDSKTFETVLQDIDIVYLLRPPQLADIPKYFEPFITEMQNQNIKKIVFLSVQGVENQKRIPHHKLEKLILENELEYAFLRPSYFMQNLTTTLLHEIKHQDKIFIPAGNLKMNWVDVKDIGLVGAHILNDFETYKNQAFEITGSELKGFEEVANIMSEELGRKIMYESPNLIKFFKEKRKLGISKPMIFVMIMLHYLPRFTRQEQKVTNIVTNITGKSPNSLVSFIKREKPAFYS